jgi:hypothetical protein
MTRFELIDLLQKKSLLNYLLNQAKSDFTKFKTLDLFNKMQDLQTQYKNLNDQIYTYKGIMYFYSLLDNPSYHNRAWGPYDIRLNRSDVIFNIDYKYDDDFVTFIILSESKNKMPSFRIECVPDQAVFDNERINHVSYDLHDQDDGEIY